MSCYILVDCNNFYISCERVFRPRLQHKPVVVLSNNDGCVVSRSEEAKALGVPMAVPFYQIAHLQKKGLCVFSSNYPLYGDLSNRVMSILSSYSGELEIYSIDEAFISFRMIDLDDKKSEEKLFAQMMELREKIYSWVGIPVTIGIAKTRTLAKLACSYGKKRKMPVFSLSQETMIIECLKSTPIEAIWGIGRKSAEKLIIRGIHNAFDFVERGDQLAQSVLGVVGKRKVYELQGIDSLEADVNDHKRDSISSSKSFGENVTDFEELQSAVISYATRCVEKLRQQDSLCHYISVYVTTGIYGSDDNYTNSHTLAIPEGSDSLRTIIAISLEALKVIFRPGLKYKKAGVGLSGLMDREFSQPSLFESKSQTEQDGKLMNTIDKIKEKMGKNALQFGVTKEQGPWQSNANFRSPHYTTEWSDILRVKA